MEQAKSGSPLRVTITGAAGQIGYILSYMIASGHMFGPSQQVILQLLELPVALKGLKGLELELQDCAFPLLNSVIITTEAEEAFKDADVCLLVGAKPRLPGMERKDLIKDNAKIFSEQGKIIDKVSKKTVKVLVVGNPANTNALICLKNAPSIPKENFMALTRLDQNRAQSQIAIKLGKPVQEVENVIIWGNHSATQFPDVSNAKVAGEPVKDLDQEFLIKEFLPLIQKRGA